MTKSQVNSRPLAMLRARWKVRLAKAVLRALGWQLRGTLPSQFWRSIVVIKTPKQWQIKALTWTLPVHTQTLDTLSPAEWTEAARQGFAQGKASIVHTQATDQQLADIVNRAKAAKGRIALCAFEPKRKFVHMHAPFKASPFPDRDIHYMRRYFRHFRFE